MSAAKQMQMQMIHCLAAIIARVHDDSVTFDQLLASCDLASRRHQRAHQASIFSNCTRRRSNMLFGNDQHMSRRLRIDIRKPNAKFIFIDAACWNIPRDDPAEKAVGRCRTIRRDLHHG